MSEILTYQKGDIIFEEGALQNWFYLIAWGHVDLYADYQGERRLLTTLGEESFFGEMGMIESNPRSATAVAADDVRLIRISEDNFEQFFTENPLKVHMLLQSVSGRIRTLTKDYLNACKAIATYVRAAEEDKPVNDDILKELQKFATVGKDY